MTGFEDVIAEQVQEQYRAQGIASIIEKYDDGRVECIIPTICYTFDGVIMQTGGTVYTREKPDVQLIIDSIRFDYESDPKSKITVFCRDLFGERYEIPAFNNNKFNSTPWTKSELAKAIKAEGNSGMEDYGTSELIRHLLIFLGTVASLMIAMYFGNNPHTLAEILTGVLGTDKAIEFATTLGSVLKVIAGIAFVYSTMTTIQYFLRRAFPVFSYLDKGE